MEGGRRITDEEEHVSFWSVNPKHIHLIDLTAFFVVLRLFVFPPLWGG